MPTLTQKVLWCADRDREGRVAAPDREGRVVTALTAKDAEKDA